MVATAPHHTVRGRLAGLAVVLATVVLAAAGALLAGAPGASAHTTSAKTTACPDATTYVTAANPVAMQDAVVCLVNRERVAHHLPELVRNARLDRSAQGWTNMMVSGGDFSHGAAFMDRITAAGFDWSNVGENIATGYQTPEAVVQAWMQSPGHCANILSPVYREVGTGVAAQGIQGTTTIDGTWTQDFGRRVGQRPLSSNFGPAQACAGQ